MFTGPLCDSCADTRYTGPACDQCANEAFTGPLCDECADPNLTGPGCNLCTAQEFSPPFCTGSGIDITWMFSNGGLCSANGVDKIKLLLTSETGETPHMEELAQGIPCDTSFGALVGTNPDPGYLPKGAVIGNLITGVYQIDATGIDAAGTSTGYEATVNHFVLPNVITHLHIVLKN